MCVLCSYLHHDEGVLHRASTADIDVNASVRPDAAQVALPFVSVAQVGAVVADLVGEHPRVERLRSIDA